MEIPYVALEIETFAFYAFASFLQKSAILKFLKPVEKKAEAAADLVGEVLAVEEGRGAEARMHARRNGAQAPNVAGVASASRHRWRHTGTVCSG